MIRRLALVVVTLALLTAGTRKTLARHRTLRETIDWPALRRAVGSANLAEPAVAIRAAREAVKVEKAQNLMRLAGDVGRVHLYRWGDGGAHFHVWFMPRPLGMLEASGMMLPLWEDVLPNVSDEELADLHDEGVV